MGRMTNLTTVVLRLGVTPRELRTKIAAWIELFGESPRIDVSGTVLCRNGELAFLHPPAPVLKIGNRYLTVDLRDEGTAQIDLVNQDEPPKIALRNPASGR